MQSQPRYIIHARHYNEECAMLCGPVETADAEYFVERIICTLRPLSDDEYMHGHAVILHTFARYSYILHGESVYWCVEWGPGMIVVRYSPDGAMAWTALRSPIPEFGRRTPTQEDLDNYDENAENHQYNLVFRAWDAQFENEERRRERGYQRANESTVKAYEAALRRVNALGDQLAARYSDRSAWEQWAEACKRNLDEWAGEGIRV